MKRCITAVSLILLLSVGALSAQSPAIVLKVSTAPGSFGSPEADGRVTITLASGAKITVPLSDIDIAQTRSASGLASTPAAASSGNPSLAELLLSPSMQEQAIQAKCEKDWATDFRMHAFCQMQQREAIGRLRDRIPSTANERAIRQRCGDEWPGDFQMINFCEEQQLKALQELQRR